jgi:hypothetical protein
MCRFLEATTTLAMPIQFRRKHFALFILLAACSSASSTISPAEDAATQDAAPDDRGLATLDASSVDTAPTADRVLPGDTNNCTLAPPGSPAMELPCSGTQIAVLRSNDGTARVTVSGRLSLPAGGCAQLDTAEIRRGTTVLQRVTDAFGAVSGSSVLAPWFDVVADPMVNAACDGEARFEVLGVYLTGRTNTGSFTARCALRPGQGAYPPVTTLTCHRGLRAPAVLSNVSVDVTSFMGMSHTLSQASVYYPRATGPMITTADATIRLIPAPALFGGMMLAPRDTNGWQTTVSQNTLPGFGNTTQLLFSQSMDAYGLDYCPVPNPMPGPMSPPPPVFLLRIAGTTTEGPFTSEAYGQFCVRRIMR